MSSSKTVGNNTPTKGYEWEYARKDLNNTKWQNFKLALYNPGTGEILGRTPKSWGGIFLFYLVFYSCLALLFSICMWFLMKSLPGEREPKYQLDESIIGTNPGLGFRPMNTDAKSSALIYYKVSDPESSQSYVDNLDEFLTTYNRNGTQNYCDYDHIPADGEVCDIDLKATLGNCSSEHDYGYPDGQPCVFVKLNKIYGWKPEFYGTDELPHEMPDSLKSYIKFASLENKDVLNTIWLSCMGADHHDAQNIGELDYFPLPGFPGYFYPFTNVPDYLSPIVAIRFKNPKAYTLINVECRAWAKNIKYKKSGVNREGSVHFELLID